MTRIGVGGLINMDKLKQTHHVLNDIALFHYHAKQQIETVNSRSEEIEFSPLNRVCFFFQIYQRQSYHSCITLPNFSKKMQLMHMYCAFINFGGHQFSWIHKLNILKILKICQQQSLYHNRIVLTFHSFHGQTQHQIHESMCSTNINDITVFQNLIKVMIIYKSVSAFDRCIESCEN